MDYSQEQLEEILNVMVVSYHNGWNDAIYVLDETRPSKEEIYDNLSVLRDEVLGGIRQTQSKEFKEEEIKTKDVALKRVRLVVGLLVLTAIMWLGGIIYNIWVSQP